MRRALVFCAVLLLITVSTVAAQVDPVVIEGSGIQTTPPFVLGGGDYLIQWTVTPTNGSGCYHGGTLEMAGNPMGFTVLGSQILPDSVPVDGETYAYGLRQGRYYLKMSSGCDWRVTITPLTP